MKWDGSRLPSASMTRIDWMELPTEPARWSMPCALTEMEPPTVKMSVDCMAFTAYLECRKLWISCQVAPLWTVMVFCASFNRI